MKLRITPDGAIHAIAPDDLSFLCQLGEVEIQRVSHVEPVQTEEGVLRWAADLSPVGGPFLSPFTKRSEAIRAEQEWLENHLLNCYDNYETKSLDV